MDLTDLRSCLGEARELGLLGPAPLDEQLEHSLAFADVVASTATTGLRLLDLGSGGGVPGLVIASALSEAGVVLLEGSTRRAAWLQSVVDRLHMEASVTVVCERAETFGRHGEQRGSYGVVTARSFGPPGVVAECAAPLLVLGGRLVVSEPPASDALARSAVEARWPPEPLAALGLGEAAYQLSRGRGFAVMELVEHCPDRYPRRVGIPEKRPIF